ncbi:hypothetical protein PG999_005907 [Apiospora kogelbergensis]|uniref:Carbohydrate-binding module family 19 domain-containing protein n=2 Tax=Apiospora kogelbergensis TaxID=1337665 RepID=A0AAW0QT88_9PEZI
MASNLAQAQQYNGLFGGLKEDSACMTGQVACVNGNIGQCGDSGTFSITPCIGDTHCFALPMNTTTGVQVGCYDPNVAGRILGESKAAPSASTSASAPASAPASATSTAATTSQVNSGQPSEVTVTVVPTEVVTSIIMAPPKETPGTKTVTEAPSTTLVTMTRSSTSPPPAILTTIVVVPPAVTSAPSSSPPPPAPVPSTTSDPTPPKPPSTLTTLEIIPITKSRHHGPEKLIPTDVPLHTTAKFIANPVVGGPVTVTVKETETVTTTTTTTDKETVTATPSA